MKEYDDYSAKERKQLAVCQRLITEKSYLLQEEIRRGLRDYGFDNISQSTVPRLLKSLGVIKIRNTRGQKIYSVNPQLLPIPGTGRPVAEMVLSIGRNGEFILTHTVAGYGRAVARILDFRALPEVLGVIAGNNIVWVASHVVKRTTLMYEQINYLLRLNIYS